MCEVFRIYPFHSLGMELKFRSQESMVGNKITREDIPERKYRYDPVSIGA